RFPYAIQLLPRVDDIKFNIQDICTLDRHHHLGITVRRIPGPGGVKLVSAIVALTGDVTFYNAEDKVKLTRRMCGNITLNAPWYHLKINSVRPHMREVCALSIWYLMRHNAGRMFPKIESFLPCDTHKFVDFHIAVLRMARGIIKEEGIDEKELSEVDIAGLGIDELYMPKCMFHLEDDNVDARDGWENGEGGGVDAAGDCALEDVMTQRELFKKVLTLVDPTKNEEAAGLRRQWEKLHGRLD
ncbi:hypothetical protein EK21DRAFT_74238, partial [Setomelanomma holmii]